MTKPFSGRELVARVARAAAARRARRPTVADGGRLVLGDVELDLASRRVRHGGELVHLTPTEFDLLVLPRRAGPARCSPARSCSTQVWGYRDGSGARTVDSHVRSLRRKLGADVVRTVHGVGYAADGTDAA